MAARATLCKVPGPPRNRVSSVAEVLERQYLQPICRRGHVFREMHRMSWLSRLFGGTPQTDGKAKRLDYLNEALVLERQGDYDAALTSYRLALRDQPNDLRVLQNMAIAFSRTGRLDEAVRAYRKALEIDPMLAGAHYGLAFLLLKRGEQEGAVKHLNAFLAHPPAGEESERWVKHAQGTLDQLKNPGAPAPSEQPTEG